MPKLSNYVRGLIIQPVLTHFSRVRKNNFNSSKADADSSTSHTAVTTRPLTRRPRERWIFLVFRHILSAYFGAAVGTGFLLMLMSLLDLTVK